ncbi:hypothetical protein L0947_08390 [Paracidovorax citrulli]|uniref:Uncharacterized protein n=1 Tax=Paracidovorax citrulli TaxID=80869 RepID=A0ABY9AU02_PARCI|nr:hypothetical protein [Paracidovorax citrulli]WIY30751.1 hypothetical protein QRO09_03215 [Paracidovorax citrulli]WIY39960.1 hypothetical protein QRO10_03150 [Paracidovorax citrulli]WIY42802.1 hypothetical protein QRO12_17870 [Paracidovorax citrulli]WIY50308.1 hypothetical protein QRO08_07000 [Paracidovorax citrulli]
MTTGTYHCQPATRLLLTVDPPLELVRVVPCIETPDPGDLLRSVLVVGHAKYGNAITQRAFDPQRLHGGYARFEQALLKRQELRVVVRPGMEFLEGFVYAHETAITKALMFPFSRTPLPVEGFIGLFAEAGFQMALGIGCGTDRHSAFVRVQREGAETLPTMVFPDFLKSLPGSGSDQAGKVSKHSIALNHH